MITFVTFKWGSLYTSEHVNALAFGLYEGMRGVPYRLICVTDQPEGVAVETFPLWDDCSQMLSPRGPEAPSCYRRLKLFDPATTRALGISDGKRVVQIDLDMLVTGEIWPLFERAEPFVGWHAKGSVQQLTYNGSMWMFPAGTLGYLWAEFNQSDGPRLAMNAGFFGSDQAILSHLLVGKGRARAGWDQSDGCYAFRDIRVSPCQPPDARLISFYGRWKPWDAETHRLAPWVRVAWERVKLESCNTGLLDLNASTQAQVRSTRVR